MQQLVTLLTLLTTQLYLMKDSGNSETTETIIDELNLCRSQTDPLLILTLSVIRPREVSVLETNVKYICRWLLQSLLQMIVKVKHFEKKKKKKIDEDNEKADTIRNSMSLRFLVFWNLLLFLSSPSAQFYILQGKRVACSNS